MAEPYLALITPLTGSPPGQGGYPTHPIAGTGHPDQGLPGQGGSPSHPIYDPAHPDQGLPPGGTPLPPGVWPNPPVPPAYTSQVIVAVHKPGQEWQVHAYPVAPSQGQPGPTPHR